MLNFDQLNEEFKSWYRQIWLDGYNDGLEDGRASARAAWTASSAVITDLEQTDEHTAADE